MKIKVAVIETLERIVEVEAEDKLAAEILVDDMYRNEKIVLDDGDYVCVEINANAVD